jgi:mannose-1-phosphate guanylyltransferase
MKKFDALLLSSGYGKRLRPLSNFLPKPLVQIQGEILLDIWIRNLVKSGVDRIYINVFYKKNLIIDFIKNHPLKKKIKIINENKLFGTLGTLKKFVKFKNKKDLIVIHSDNFTKTLLTKFIKFSQNDKSNSHGSMMVYKSNDFKNEGIVKYDNQLFLSKIYEKKKIKMGNYANCAIYFFKKECLKMILKKSFSNKQKDIAKDLIPLLYYKIKVFIHENYFTDIGNINKLNKAQYLKTKWNH